MFERRLCWQGNFLRHSREKYGGKYESRFIYIRSNEISFNQTWTSKKGTPTKHGEAVNITNIFLWFILNLSLALTLQVTISLRFS